MGVSADSLPRVGMRILSGARRAAQSPQTAHTASRIRGDEKGAGRARLARGDGFATHLRLTAGRVHPEPAAWGTTMCRAWAHPAEVKLLQDTG